MHVLCFLSIFFSRFWFFSRMRGLHQNSLIWFYIYISVCESPQTVLCAYMCAYATHMINNDNNSQIKLALCFLKRYT